MALLCMAAYANADAPRPAKELLDAAMKRAKAEKKAIFVVFDASW